MLQEIPERMAVWDIDSCLPAQKAKAMLGWEGLQGGEKSVESKSLVLRVMEKFELFVSLK